MGLEITFESSSFEKKEYIINNKLFPYHEKQMTFKEFCFLSAGDIIIAHKVGCLSIHGPNKGFNNLVENHSEKTCVFLGRSSEVVNNNNSPNMSYAELNPPQDEINWARKGYFYNRFLSDLCIIPYEQGSWNQINWITNTGRTIFDKS